MASIHQHTDFAKFLSERTLRQNLSRYMDEAIDSRAPIIVTRQAGKGNVVIMSEDEFDGWLETVHLLSNPVNAARLLKSIGSATAGHAEARELVRDSSSE